MNHFKTILCVLILIACTQEIGRGENKQEIHPNWIEVTNNKYLSARTVRGEETQERALIAWTIKESIEYENSNELTPKYRDDMSYLVELPPIIYSCKNQCAVPDEYIMSLDTLMKNDQMKGKQRDFILFNKVVACLNAGYFSRAYNMYKLYLLQKKKDELFEYYQKTFRELESLMTAINISNNADIHKDKYIWESAKAILRFVYQNYYLYPGPDGSIDTRLFAMKCNELLNKYPKSKYVGNAKYELIHIDEGFCSEGGNNSEDLRIAKEYEKLLKDYPDIDNKAEVYYRIALNYKGAAIYNYSNDREQSIQNRTKSLLYLDRIINEYPNSTWCEKAIKLKDKKDTLMN